jgi:ribonucleotide monophosphatase NagD (HAD superfamily)
MARARPMLQRISEHLLPRTPAVAACQQLSVAASTSSSSPRIVSGLREVAGEFDAFILDQWGVLHDGSEAIEGAPECFAALAAAGKQLIILSNDGARKASGKTGVSRLTKMGYDTTPLVGSVLAGEEAIQWMLREYAGRRTKCTWMAWSAGGFERTYTDGLDLELVPFEETELIIAQGTARVLTSDADLDADPARNLQYSKTGEVDEVAERLRAAAARDAVLVCCNPDLKTVKRTSSGAEVAEYCPGGIARFYESCGGKVVWFGKPFAEHFEACLRELGITDKSRVAMVGDALETDVLGARNAGIASVLVASGIHGEALHCTGETLPALAEVEKLCDEFDGITPSFVVPRFVW